MDKFYGNPDEMFEQCNMFDFLPTENFELAKVVDYLKSAPEYADKLIVTEDKTEDYHAFYLMVRDRSVQGLAVVLLNDNSVSTRLFPLSSPGDVRLLIDCLNAVAKLYCIGRFLWVNQKTIFFPTEENYAKVVSYNLSQLNLELMPKGRCKHIRLLENGNIYYADLHEACLTPEQQKRHTIQVMEERVRCFWKYRDIYKAKRLELVRDNKKSLISFLSDSEPVIFDETQYIGLIDLKHRKTSKLTSRKTFVTKVLDLGYGEMIDAVRLLVHKLTPEQWKTLYDSFRNTFVDSPPSKLL